MPREREVEAQFPPPGGGAGHRSLQAEQALDLSLGCFLQQVSLCSAQCTATQSSPALSDDSLGKRTEESATMHFASTHSPNTYASISYPADSPFTGGGEGRESSNFIGTLFSLCY